MIMPDLLSGSIITTRIRLARNLSGYPFNIKDVPAAKNVIKNVNRALVKCGTFNLYYVGNLDAVSLEAMKERHLISPELMENRKCGAVLINSDETLSVMVHEEDVIREQCFMRGLRLAEAYKRLEQVDDELSKTFDFAYDERYGYLTACPTNVGTGMRASVMLFLPALSETNAIIAAKRKVEREGLTVRGLYGEGSAAEGYMYQISNEVTLGLSEYDILKKVESTVLWLCEEERAGKEALYGTQELRTMDKAKKSFGVLTNAVMLSYGEFLTHIANVKLGAMLGMIGIADIEGIDDLMVAVRPANLCKQHGKELSATERDLFRAEIVGKKLMKLRD